jgi:opacity protein-like surface antigen
VSYTRIDVPDSASPPITPIATFNFGPTSRSETINNRVFFGYTAGLGIDIAVLPNVFVRAEWEYVQFKTFQDVNLHLNTVRAGVGVRF